MYLSRYTLSRPPDILEIEPSSGAIIRRFRQPKDWRWTPERDKAIWEVYRGQLFLVYKYDGSLVFQPGDARFVLDGSYAVSQQNVYFFWRRFRLYWNNVKVFSFTYRDPQTRLWSLLLALGFDDDWFDWDTPFEDVEKWCNSAG